MHHNYSLFRSQARQAQRIAILGDRSPLCALPAPLNYIPIVLSLPRYIFPCVACLASSVLPEASPTSGSDNAAFLSDKLLG